MRQHVGHEAEQRDHGDIRIAFIQHGVGIGANGDVQLYAEPGVVACVLAGNLGVNVDGADDLRALFI